MLQLPPEKVDFEKSFHHFGGKGRSNIGGKQQKRCCQVLIGTSVSKGFDIKQKYTNFHVFVPAKQPQERLSQLNLEKST